MMRYIGNFSGKLRRNSPADVTFPSVFYSRIVQYRPGWLCHYNAAYSLSLPVIWCDVKHSQVLYSQGRGLASSTLTIGLTVLSCTLLFSG